MKRFVIVVLDSLGIGEMPDAAKYTDAGANICSYSNAEFDKLMNEGRTTYDKELRKKAYTDAFMIAKEDAPMTWIAGGYLYSAVRKDVEGLVGYPTQKFSFTNVTRK